MTSLVHIIQIAVKGDTILGLSDAGELYYWNTSADTWSLYNL